MWHQLWTLLTNKLEIKNLLLLTSAVGVKDDVKLLVLFRIILNTCLQGSVFGLMSYNADDGDWIILCSYWR